MAAPPILGRKRQRRTARKTFKLDGDPHVYVCRRLTASGWAALLDAYAELETSTAELGEADDTEESPDREAQVSQLKAITDQYVASVESLHNLLRALLVTESADHLIARLESDAEADDWLDYEGLGELLPEIIGVVSGRPTGQPSDS